MDKGTQHHDTTSQAEPWNKAQWLARLSAPGYMDCTDWAAFGTRKEAEEYLIEYYGDDDDSDGDDDNQPEA